MCYSLNFYLLRRFQVSLKTKWYAVAIDVCHQVLKKHLDYSKIVKEIL